MEQDPLPAMLTPVVEVPPVSDPPVLLPVRVWVLQEARDQGIISQGLGVERELEELELIMGVAMKMIQEIIEG